MNQTRRIGLPAMLLSALALVCATLTLPGPLGSWRAAADPPYATEGTVTAIAFSDETVVSGRLTGLEGAWSIPDNPTAPAGFVVDLPPGLQGLADSFDLLDPNGELTGTCTVTTTQIVCDLSEAYIIAHPFDIAGNFFVNVRLTDEVSQDTTKSYQFGDLSADIDVTPAPSCTGCVFGGSPAMKGGFFSTALDRFVWTVTVPLPVTGAAAGTTITVSDTLGAGQSFDTVRSPQVLRSNTVGVNPANGRPEPVNYTRVPARDITVSADRGIATFVADQGYFYLVRWYSIVDPDSDLDTFTNDASITVGSAEPVLVTGSAKELQSGGTGNGRGTTDEGPNSPTPPGTTPGTLPGTVLGTTPATTLPRPRLQTRVQTKVVRPDTKVQDLVFVSGLVDGGASVGTATVYGPFGSDKIGPNQCRGARAVETVSFDARNGKITTPAVRLREVGYYTWVITLSADASNAAASHGCGIDAETLLVSKPDYGPVVINTGYNIAAAAAPGISGIGFLDRSVFASRLIFQSIGTDASMVAVGIGARGAMVPSQIGEVGRLSAGAQIGDAVGTAVIVGHVSDRLDRPGALYRLRDAHAGQVVRARGDDGRWHAYRVVSVKRYDRSKPLPASIFSTSGAARLAVVSCAGRTPLPGGRFHYSENVVVSAKMIS